MPAPVTFVNAILTTIPLTGGYGLIENGAIVIENDKIIYAGPSESIPLSPSNNEIVDLQGRLVTPGLIDCHTHLIYGGSRAKEFELRQRGMTYEEITHSGGGIFSTVKATRNASDDELLTSALARLDQLIESGVTTVEIKSGYGLDSETELRMLRLAREMEKLRPIRISTTFLGAHATPKGMTADTYLDTICIPTLEIAAQEGLIDAVDGFCETIAFSPEQIGRLFSTAQKLNLPVKLHAEQLSNQNGARLAAKFNALSADHLEYINEAGVKDMKTAGTIAVLLPGAYYFLKETQKPPITDFKTHNVPLAIATDSNPGSSPVTSILLAMNMAAVQFGLTPEECLRGVTINAANALGHHNIGRLDKGSTADLVIWETDHPAELTYRMSNTPIYQRIFGGI